MSEKEKVQSMSTVAGVNITVTAEGICDILMFTIGEAKFSMFVEEGKALAASILSIMGIDLFELEGLKSINIERQSEIENLKTLLDQETKNVKKVLSSLAKFREISEENEKEIKLITERVEAAIANSTKARAEQKKINEDLKTELAKYKNIAKNNQAVCFHGLKKKSSNKWKKKFKKLKAESKKEFDVMFENKQASQAEIAMLQERVDREIKNSTALKKERDQLQKTVSYLTTCSKIMYNGEPLKSPILEMVALERKDQLDKKRTIEMDVLHNQDGSLVEAALYCLDSEGYEYPKSWHVDFKNNLKDKTKEQKLIYAAALLIAHGDMLKYIREKNEYYDKLAK